MNLETLPSTLEEAHAMIEQLQWRVGQLEKQIYGPTSDRAPATEENLSKEQILMALFPPPAELPAASEVAVDGDSAQTEKAPRRRQMRTPAARELETSGWSQRKRFARTAGRTSARLAVRRASASNTSRLRSFATKLSDPSWPALVVKAR